VKIFFFLIGFNRKNKINIYEVDTEDVQFKTRYLMRKYITVNNILNCCEIKSLHWLNDNNYLISLCGSKRRIFLWSISNKKIIKQIKTISKSNCMKIIDEKLIIIGTKFGRLEIYEFNLAKPVVSVMEHNGTIWCIDIFIEKFKIITTGSDKNLIIWIINEKKIIPIKKIQLLEQTTFVKTLSSKKMIFVSVTSGSVIIFCSETLEFKKQINCHSLPVLSIEISISLNLLITGSSDSSIGIWDLNFLYQKKLITDKNEGITSVALINWVNNLVSGTRNGTIKVWNLFSYSLIAQYFFIHQGPVWSIVTSINCKYLASGSSDSSIIIWRLYPNDTKSLDENTISKNNLLDTTIIKSDNKNYDVSHINSFKTKSSRFKFTKFLLKDPNSLLMHIVDITKKNKKVLPNHFDLKTTIFLLKEVIKKNNKIKLNPEFQYIKIKIKNKLTKELLEIDKFLELINNLL